MCVCVCGGGGGGHAGITYISFTLLAATLRSGKEVTILNPAQVSITSSPTSYQANMCVLVSRRSSGVL